MDKILCGKTHYYPIFQCVDILPDGSEQSKMSPNPTFSMLHLDQSHNSPEAYQDPFLIQGLYKKEKTSTNDKSFQYALL